MKRRRGRGNKIGRIDMLRKRDGEINRVRGKKREEKEMKTHSCSPYNMILVKHLKQSK